MKNEPFLILQKLRAENEFRKRKKEGGKGRGKTFDLTTITNRCKGRLILTTFKRIFPDENFIKP